MNLAHKTDLLLLPNYTYNDLYVRSLNMAYKLKQNNTKYILYFLPNCIEYMECIFACILSNINSVHCSYNNILKYLLLPDIDIIITTHSHLRILNLLLTKCNDEIIKDIKNKTIIVTGHMNGSKLTTKRTITDDNVLNLYKTFLHSNTTYQIFPQTTSDNLGIFIKASVQYIQYQSYQSDHFHNKYMKPLTKMALFPYELCSLKGIISLFHIINTKYCILNLNSQYRLNEECIESVSNIHFIFQDNIHISDTTGINTDKDMNKLYYDKTDNMIKYKQTYDIFNSTTITGVYHKLKSENAKPGIAFQDVILELEPSPNPTQTTQTTPNLTYDKIFTKSICLNNLKYNMSISVPTHNIENIINNGVCSMNNSVNMYVETVDHIIYMKDLYKLKDIFKRKYSFIPLIQYISTKGLKLKRLINQINIYNERIFGIILLSDRKTLVYVYSKFANINQVSMHAYVLNELYKNNGISINFTKVLTKHSKEPNFDKAGGLKTLLPLRVSEIFYIITYLISHIINKYKYKWKNKWTNKVKLIKDFDKDIIVYDFDINKPFLNEEWTLKLKAYCEKENIPIDLFIKITCAMIIYKNDPSLNIKYKYDKTGESDGDSDDDGDDDGDDSATYINYKDIPMLYDFPGLRNIYMRILLDIRPRIFAYLSMKTSIPRNRIYIDVKHVQGRGTGVIRPRFHDQSMINIISLLEFNIGESITYNLFGIKINSHYLIASSVIHELRNNIRFIIY
jgi:hypothetical protein